MCEGAGRELCPLCGTHSMPVGARWCEQCEHDGEFLRAVREVVVRRAATVRHTVGTLGQAGKP
jgi:hypothetical protein